MGWYNLLVHLAILQLIASSGDLKAMSGASADVGTFTPHLGSAHNLDATDKLIAGHENSAEAERFRFGVIECLGLSRGKSSYRYWSGCAEGSIPLKAKESGFEPR